MGNIRDLLNKIRYATYGKEVRQSIHDAIEECYATASVDHDNANMEVKIARGTHNTLNERFTSVEENIKNNSEQLEHIIPSIELSILVFGGNGDGIFDNSEAFKIALNSLRENGGGTLLVPKGKFIVNENIEIDGQRICLKLRSGAEIIRPQSSSNKKALIHMWGVYNSIKGDGQANSLIKCENESPFGVVSIGDRNDVETVKGACGYNTISGVMIEGQGKRNSGDGNIGLHMMNRDGVINWSYYHNVHDVHIRYCNTGIALIGNANANIIDRITLTYCGNEPILEDDCGILLKDLRLSESGEHPLDNCISNVFHTASKNAITILQKGRSNANSFVNINGEPGHTVDKGSKWYVVKDDDEHTRKSSGNTIIGSGSYYGGYSIPEWFMKSNSVIFGGMVTTNKEVIAHKTNFDLAISENRINNGYSLNFEGRNIEKYFVLSGVEQGKNYELFRFNIGSNKNIIKFEIDLIFDSIIADGLNKSGKIILSYNGGNWNNVKIEGYAGIEPMELFNMPVKVADEIIFTCKTPTLGTSTKFNGTVFIKVFSNLKLSEDKIILPLELISPDINYEQIVLTRGGSGVSRKKGYFIGQSYLNTQDGKFSIYNGDTWIDLN